MPSGAEVWGRTRIVLNAANVTGRGASILVANLVPELYAALPEAEFITLVPRTPELMEAVQGDRATVVAGPVRRGPLNDLGRLYDLHRRLRRIVERSGAGVCLTLGDLGPAGLPCPHVVFLHNPLFVYSTEELAGRGDWPPLKRGYLLWQFRRTIRHASRIIVQTPVMRDRLAARFAVDASAVEVIPQPVPRHVTRRRGEPGRTPIGACAKPIRLLFLAAYYGHKNHRVLPSVARELRARGLADRVQIFITLGGTAPATLRAELAGCTDVVTDLGPLGAATVADALADATALFLPSLVESYGLIYLEAMASGRPILTSDRDFARWMCGETARYFDPLDARSIVDAIGALPELARADLRARAEARLRELPADWLAVAARFARALPLPRG